MEQEKIQQMQFLEQNLQSIIMQKQAFQMELAENSSALREIEKSTDTVYKVIGQLMISVEKDSMVEELKNKEKLIQTRADALDKQEASINEELQKMRDELLGSLKK